ncbi:MAG: hypothetical protein JST16_07970 [Bdellovibrionales bacterium]|nr:hypothetical protein [Bdellovibrionales bacterium]
MGISSRSKSLCVIFGLLLAVPATAGRRKPASQPITPAWRMQGRNFPSLFQAWTAAEVNEINPSDSATAALARHDLVFMGPAGWGLASEGEYSGLSDTFKPASLVRARKYVNDIRALNPQALLLVEIRYNDAQMSEYPPDSVFWKRDAHGAPISVGGDMPTYFNLDLGNAQLRERVAAQCRNVVATGLFDGCMFDWWNGETPERIELLRQVRGAVGDDAVLMGNVNGTLPVQSAPYLNGMYMEGFGADFFSDWRTAAKNLLWAESHLRRPAIAAFDIWYRDIRTSPKALKKEDRTHFRFGAALALIHSNGFILHGNGAHAHELPNFLAKGLGSPLDPVGGRYFTSGLMNREFTLGTVACNPPDNAPVTVNFREPRTSRATGRRANSHVLPPGDGDIFLK